LQRGSWLRANVVLANSKAGLRAYRVSQRQGRVIYNGVDLKRFGTMARAVSRGSLGIGEADFVVGMVANFTQYKDQPTLIRAAAKLLERGTPLWVLFIGEGPTRQACEAMVQESGRADRFLFLGHQLHPEDFIPIFDVGILTSAETGEGCSNAVLECMAMGKPVIATAAGGNKEIVDEGYSGYLVGVGDHELLATRLLELSQDPALRMSMGQQGKRAVAERFSQDRMVRDFVSLYQGLVAEHVSISTGYSV
jgi:glycosyltransferase involved in cell wall biosynthesis